MILATDIIAEGTASITVFNPTPSGGTSGPQPFQITTAVGGGDGGGSFIATAAYGMSMVQDVPCLRAFQNEYLLQTNEAGRCFVTQ